MTLNGLLQIAVYFAALFLLARPLGRYMAKVYRSEPCFIDVIVRPVERLVYRIAGVRPEAEMSWRTYAGAVLLFGFACTVSLYTLQRLQGWLPFNPQGLRAVSPDLAWNTAVSFATNTNWQSYAGETTLSPLTQMAGLGAQNFLSAAVGMAVLAAVIRGFARATAQTIGNFWVDLTRSVLYVLLPLSAALALLLVWQGVPQGLGASRTLVPLQAAARQAGDRPSGTPSGSAQVIPTGPVASQVAIKQLGTNGGGYFNANSSHPFENPTPLSNLLELLAILLIPVALCTTFGRMVADPRQGRALLGAMAALLLPLLILCVWSEQRGNGAFEPLGVDQAASDLQAGGNMEGKEVRFGVVSSALWATATTAASNGSVNAMHDSFTPLGGLVPLLLMQLGEVVFGGVGSGLYGMLVFAIVAVFIAGLMVGRTPEYLGKKIEPFEMKMASLAILVPAALVLVGTAAGVACEAGVAGIANPGPHGFTEVLYAFSSAANNNGSAFAGLSANSPFYNLLLGVAMFLGRYGVIVPVLAIAGSLAEKKRVPAGAGTLPTHTPLFVVLLVSVVLLVGALTFLPALALGPIAEHLGSGR